MVAAPRCVDARFGPKLRAALGLLAELDEQPLALVVESSFTAAVDVGAEAFPWLPVRLLMRQRFDSLERAPRVSCPSLVLHGTADELIGVHHGRSLALAERTGSGLQP